MVGFKKTKFCFLLFLCLLLVTSLCSCKKANDSEENYLSNEVMSVERVDSETSAKNEDDSMKTKSVEQKTNAVSSQKEKQNNSTVSNTEVKQYKYEYEYFDKKYYTNSVLSTGNSERLKNAFKKAKSGQKITVAFIGGSITEGTGASKTTCYSALVSKWFEGTFGAQNVKYVNAGIGTAGSLFGVHRVDNDVLSYNPDVVFVDFAVNDKGKNPELEQATFDALIQKVYNSSSKPAIISIAMATKTKWNNESDESDICRNYEIPMLSFSKYIHATILVGKYTWKDAFIDEVHPNKVGHKIISELAIYYLEKVLSEIDKQGSSAAEKITSAYIPESARFISAKRINPTQISTISNTGFSSVNSEFQYTNGYWETTTENAQISFAVKTKTLTLFFGKLPADGGHFELYIDGNLIEKYACATSDSWEYINSKVVASYDSVENHTITIKNVSESGARVLISGIGVTS